MAIDKDKAFEYAVSEECSQRVKSYYGRGSEFSFEDLSDEEMYAMLGARDESFQGVYFIAVTSTKIYCRPGCSARMPMRKNCKFFKTAEEAEAAGFRACKKCKPELLKEQQ